MKRLTRVGDTVKTTVADAEQARDDVGDAYGVLFGWAIKPMLNRVCDASADFSEELGQAMDASTRAIKATQDAYNNTEYNNADRNSIVSSAVAEASSQVRR